MTDTEGSPFEFDETLALAGAIGQRYAQIQENIERIVATVSGAEYTHNAEQQQAIKTGWAALMLARVSSPDTAVSMEEMVTTISGGKAGFEAIAADFNDHTGGETEVTGEAIKALQESIYKEHQARSGGGEEQMTQNFMNELAAARDLAAERGIELAAVYADEALYYEAASREMTPQEASEKVIKSLKTISAEFIMSMGRQMVQTMMPPDILEQLGPEEMAEMVEEISNNPQAQAMCAEAAEVQQEAMRQSFLFEFIKTYGFAGLADLTSEQRDGILPKSEPAEQLAALIRERQD